MNNLSLAVDLLVSVRSVAEAHAALAGGAGLIDVKEPARGALGRADSEVIRAIAAMVAGRRPVSAALGEWAENSGGIPDAEIAYVKWGLAGCRRRPNWRGELRELMARQKTPRVVLAAYADWECAQAPPIDDVFALAAEQPGGVMLLDTHCKEANNVVKKDRPTLLDWLPLDWVADFVARCRESHVKIALAGSLGWAEIEQLLPLRPDWIAVRGAACADGNRQADIDPERVRRLVALLRAARACSPACQVGHDRGSRLKRPNTMLP